MHDPDPEDRRAGLWAIGIAILFLVYFIHLISFRILATDTELISGSLLSKKHIIQMNEKFDFQEDETGESIFISQCRSKIKISWNIKGHWDFHDLILKAHHQLHEG